jgi:hypothetical protein
MAQLGASAPAATTEVDLYTVPPKRSAAIVVVAVERAGGTPTYRIAIGPNGAGSIANEDYVAYGKAATAYLHLIYGPYEIEDGDIVTVYASDANMTFQVYGVEELLDE